MQSFHKAIFAILILAAFAGPLSAEEFRVESKVFVSDSEKPVSDSLTLFHNGRAYDLLSSPPEITVFDLAENRIVLLDPARKLRTEVTTGQLTTFVNQLRVRGITPKDAILEFSAEPKFAEAIDDDGRLSFVSPHMSYRIRGSLASNPAMVKAYREFADWTANLSSLVRQGGQPPLPRLAVNAGLERRGWLPDEVERTIIESGRLKTKQTVLRSTHKFETQLYPADHKRIDEADKFSKDFQFVELEKYLLSAQQAKR